MKEFTSMTARAVPLRVNDIDTDQIIPARFLTATSRTGMGELLFADLRLDRAGQKRADFPLNKEQFAGAEILIAGANFGCGSSREHAAWALAGYGFRAVISSSFADIFYGNALKNGLLPVKVESSVLDTLLASVEQNPDLMLTMDLQTQTLSWSGGSCSFPIEPFAKQCLLHGVDELGYIMRFRDAIEAYESQREGRVIA
jgi:3-isopropylmalate/(R)-2-methylmalate dehydratase small subunit